jgi:hypothetical protein
VSSRSETSRAAESLSQLVELEVFSSPRLYHVMFKGVDKSRLVCDTCESSLSILDPSILVLVFAFVNRLF